MFHKHHALNESTNIANKTMHKLLNRHLYGYYCTVSEFHGETRLLLIKIEEKREPALVSFVICFIDVAATRTISY